MANANIKISQLPAATSVFSTDIFPIVSSNVTYKATLSQVAALVLTGNAAGSNTANYVLQAAQPNITTIGNGAANTTISLNAGLTRASGNMVVMGNLTANNLNLTTLNVTNLSVSNNVSAASFMGDGGNVSNVTAVGLNAPVGNVRITGGNLGDMLMSYGNGSTYWGPLVVGNANYANFANISNVANSVAGSNVVGAVGSAVYAISAGNATNAVNASVATSANSVAGANVVGAVANATYAALAGSSNSVAGANVVGEVANATYATSAGSATTATTASSATVAASANSVALANVVGAGNVAALNLDGNIGNVLAGDGTWIGLPVNTKIENGASNVDIPTAGGDVEVWVNSSLAGLFSLNETTITGNLLPSANITYDLGSPTQRWKDIYLSNNTIYLGDSAIGVTSGNLTIDGKNLISQSNAGVTDLGSASNLTITGGSNGQVLSTDGAGNLSWTTVSSNASEITNTDGYSTYSVSVSNTGVVSMNTARGGLEVGAQPEEGAPQHLHIMRSAGDGGSTDLFFGDDHNYVKMPGLYGPGTQGVEIGSSYGGGPVSVWRFDTDGGLTLPGNLTAASGASPAPSLNGFSSLQAFDNIIIGSANIANSGTDIIVSGDIKSRPNNVIAIKAINDGADNPAQLVSSTTGLGATTAISAYANQALIQANINGDIKTWQFNNDGNMVLPGNTFAVKYANGTQVALGGGGGTYGDSNVATLLSSFGSNSISTTGNITANNFSGNITIIGNVTGTSPNVSLVAGSYTMTFDNTGVLTLPTIGGDEGGEINFGIPATNTTLIDPVKVDVFQDRIRFFDGSTKGAYIDLSQAATGVNTLLNNRVSAFVNAGTFVTMDNIRATVTTSGQRGLSLATVTGSFAYNIGGTFAGASVGSSGTALAGQTLTTTPTASIFGWGFTVAGDIATYVITNTSSLLSYRITLQIGDSFNNNMISIERLI